MIHPVFIGCDVSKAHLDIFDSRNCTYLRIDNLASCIETWLDSLGERNVTVIFEATSPYDRRLCVILTCRGYSYCRVNPARARDFARACGLLAKTDAIDARMLARMGETLRPPTSKPPDPVRHRLGQLHARRDQLVAMRQQERNRLHSAEPQEGDGIERHIAWLDTEIAMIEKACLELVRADTTLKQKMDRLRSIPGVGPVTAFTLIALMPELGEAPQRAMAALAGLAPFNVDSGHQRGQRHIRGGRKRVRDALYMAALVAYRLKKPFACTAQAMSAKGKPFKVMIIAIARKILTLANAMLRDQTMYKPA